MAKLASVTLCAVLAGAVGLASGCGSGGKSQPPQQTGGGGGGAGGGGGGAGGGGGGAGGGGGGAGGGGQGAGIPGDTVPWSGSGDPYTGTSASLVRLDSPTIVFAADYVLSGTVSAGVTSVDVELNGAAADSAPISGDVFTLSITLRPGANDLSITATDAAGAHAPFNLVVGYENGAATSAALIDAALASHAISAEDAIVYRVYAAFGDPRLPTVYAGARAPDGTRAMADALSSWSTLSATAQAALGPYFTPEFFVEGARPSASAVMAPAHSAALPSCWSCTPDPDWLSTTGPHIRVWWHRLNGFGAKQASAIADAVELPVSGAWAVLEQLLGNVPLAASWGGVDSGLNIVIAEDMVDDGITIPTGLGQPHPVFIRVNRNLTSRKIVGASIHELMHAFTFGRRVALSGPTDYISISEATANWATNRVVPTNNWEHQYSVWFREPDKGLFFKDNPYHPYGSWIFYAWLSNQLGDGVIRNMWDLAATLTDQAQIVDTAISMSSNGAQSLEKLWPKFIADAWNGEPRRALMQLDKIPDRPAFADDVAVSTGGSAPLDPTLTGPGARFYRYTFPNPDVRTILFLDGVGHRLGTDQTVGYQVAAPALFPLSDAQKRGITVLARRLEAQATWTWTDTENWTTAEPPQAWDHDGHASGKIGYGFLCTEDRGVQELQIAIAYADGSSPVKQLASVGDPPRLVASRAPCFNLAASASIQDRFSDAADGSYDLFSNSYDGYLQSFGLYTDSTDAGGGTLMYGIKFSGQTTRVHWSREGYDAATRCSWSGSNTVTNTGSDLDISPLFLFTWASPPLTGAFDWNGFSLWSTQVLDQHYVQSCPPPPQPPPDPNNPNPPPPPPPVTTTVDFSLERFELGSYFQMDPLQQTQMRFSAQGQWHVDVGPFFGYPDYTGTADLRVAPSQ